MIRDFMRGIPRGMRQFSEGIAAIVNATLLSLVYLTAVGLTSVAARLSGKRFLESGCRKATYWETANIDTKKPERLCRQF